MTMREYRFPVGSRVRKNIGTELFLHYSTKILNYSKTEGQTMSEEKRSEEGRRSNERRKESDKEAEYKGEDRRVSDRRKGERRK